MSRASKTANLIVGGESRVDLLPQELRVKRKGKVLRRRLGFLVVLVAVMVVGISTLVRAQGIQAKSDLSIAQANTRSILLQQRKYEEVSAIQKQVETVQAAQQVGT